MPLPRPDGISVSRALSFKVEHSVCRPCMAPGLCQPVMYRPVPTVLLKALREA